MTRFMLGRSWLLGLLIAVLLACRQGAGGNGETDETTETSEAPDEESAAEEQPAEDGIAAPESPEPLPYAVGQWTKHRLSSPDGSSSDLTYSIIDQEGDAFWVEMVNEGGSGPLMVIQFLIAVPDRTKPETADLKRVKMKMGNQVRELSGPMMNTIRKQFGNIAERLTIPEMKGKPQETVEVPAGKFRGAYKQRYESKIMGFESKVVMWHHPAVPITALVEMKGVDDSTHMELVDYGIEGAKSRLEP